MQPFLMPSLLVALAGRVRAICACLFLCCSYLSTHAFLFLAFFRSRTRGCSCCCTALQIDTSASYSRLSERAREGGPATHRDM